VSRLCRRHARRLRSRRASRKRQQSDVPRALDRHAQPALVPRANSRHAARQNLSALLHELRQNVRALVVDEVHLLDAKLANFLLAKILPLPARTSARSSWTSTTRPAFSTRTTMSAARSAVPAAFTPWSAGSAFASRCWSLRLYLFVCHALPPFHWRSRPCRCATSDSLKLFFCYSANDYAAGAGSAAAGATGAAAAAGAVVLRGRRAARLSRLSPSFFCSFISSSSRTV
jgi:hypothetical protein